MDNEREEAARYMDACVPLCGTARTKEQGYYRLAASALRSIESSEGAVAWICDDDTPDTTPVWEQAEEWRLAGRPVTPLFTRLAEVTEELAFQVLCDYWRRVHGSELTPNALAVESMRAALQAALRRE